MTIKFSGQTKFQKAREDAKTGSPKRPKVEKVEIQPWDEKETEIFEMTPKEPNIHVKITTTIRFSPEVREYFEGRIGRGWQTEINRVLLEYVISQKLKLRKDDDQA